MIKCFCSVAKYVQEPAHLVPGAKGVFRDKTKAVFRIIVNNSSKFGSDCLVTEVRTRGETNGWMDERTWPANNAFLFACMQICKKV